MASPFPGMDPYLESKEIWPGFHHLLADEIMAQLNARLSDKYYADVEVKTFLEEVGIATTRLIYPDAAVVEVDPQTAVSEAPAATLTAPIQRVALPAGQAKTRSVKVYLAESQTLVTAVEILSPVNKRSQGLEDYRQKRGRLLRSTVHLVELDLLRGGRRPGWELEEPPLDTDYICLVNRGDNDAARLSDIWPVALNEPLPTLPIPLLPPDPDILLDLGDVLENIYARAAYARRVDYTQPVPPPTLRPVMQHWLETANIR